MFFCPSVCLSVCVCVCALMSLERCSTDRWQISASGTRCSTVMTKHPGPLWSRVPSRPTHADCCWPRCPAIIIIRLAPLDLQSVDGSVSGRHTCGSVYGFFVRGSASPWICQECTVADDVPSRAEDCTFPVVVRQWLGDRDCTAQYNCCLPATILTVGDSVVLFFFSFFLILYGAPAMTW